MSIVGFNIILLRLLLEICTVFNRVFLLKSMLLKLLSSILRYFNAVFSLTSISSISLLYNDKTSNSVLLLVSNLVK